jgi:STE24 endopeptidase
MLNYLFFIIVGVVSADYLLGTLLGWLNRRAASPELPKAVEGIYDADEYARQQRYFKANNAFGSLTRTYEYALLLVMLFVGGYGLIDGLAYAVTPSPVLAALLFFAVIYFGNDLLTLPFDYYRTFVIEERFGFNTMTPRLFFGDLLKGWLVASLLGGTLIAAAFLLHQRWGVDFWIYVWLMMAAITVLGSMFYSSIIVPLFNRQEPLAEGSLRDAIERFAREAGFDVSDIYVIDGSRRSTKANAYFTGLGRRKRIVLYDTLINTLSTREVVAVLAHEVGHYRLRHTQHTLLLSLLNSFILLYVFSLLVDNTTLAHAMGGRFATFELGLIAFTLLYSPVELVIGILMNALSRRNEYQADRFAADCGLAAPLASALKKLAVGSLTNLTPSRAYVFCYYSHPTLLQRLQRLEASQTSHNL